MHPELLSPKDDRLAYRDAGLQAVVKLDYVRRYMDMFVTSMRARPWRQIRYIDLFAGPGKCCIRETGEIVLGSPLLALSTAHAFTSCVFADLKVANTEALRIRCAASDRADTVTIRQGDSNALVAELAAQFEAEDRVFIPDRWQSLNLAFLDPEGFELHWSTVETLARLRTDLIVYYPQAGLQRNFELFLARDSDTHADHYFGGSEWRTVYKQHVAEHGTAGVHRALMDLYRDNLAALGYQEVVRDDEVEPLMRAYKTRAPLYRLLFASKHPLGHTFWRSVTQSDAHGQRRLF